MSASSRDLVRWVRRYEAVEREIRAERRGHPLAPEESLRLALSLADLTGSPGVPDGGPEPSEEDLAAWSAWARLRA